MVASSGLTSASVEFVRNKPNYKVLNLDDIIRMSQQGLNKTQPITKETTQHKPKQKAITGRKLDIWLNLNGYNSKFCKVSSTLSWEIPMYRNVIDGLEWFSRYWRMATSWKFW